jgi:hypothetical protein
MIPDTPEVIKWGEGKKDRKALKIRQFLGFSLD